MQMDPNIRQALASISWQQKGDEWLGKLNHQISPAQWKELRAVTAMIRMPYNASRKRFVLPAPFTPEDIIRTTLKVGSVPNPKDNDFFPTPPDGAAYMCKRAENDLADYILEPNAGSGAIVAAAIEAFPNAKITAVEYDPLNVALLRHHYPNINVIEADFLTWTPDREYDLVLMNPPFTAHGGYAAHIQKAMQCLHDYGKLYSVTSANLLNKSDKAHKKFLEQVAEWEGFVEDFEFEFADTGIKTMLLELTKQNPWMHKPYRGYASYKEYLIDFEAMNDSKCNETAFKWAKALYASKGDPATQFQPFAEAVRNYFRDNARIYIGISFTDEELKTAACDFYRQYLINSFGVDEDELHKYIKSTPAPKPAPQPAPAEMPAIETGVKVEIEAIDRQIATLERSNANLQRKAEKGYASQKNAIRPPSISSELAEKDAARLSQQEQTIEKLQQKKNQLLDIPSQATPAPQPSSTTGNPILDALRNTGNYIDDAKGIVVRVVQWPRGTNTFAGEYWKHGERTIVGNGTTREQAILDAANFATSATLAPEDTIAPAKIAQPAQSPKPAPVKPTPAPALQLSIFQEHTC